MGNDDTAPRRLWPLFTWRSAVSDSDIDPTTKHVAVALSLYMNERGGSAWPGAERLAADTGRHVRTVRRSLSWLVENGWLEVVGKGGRRGGKRIANEYRAVVPPNVGETPPFAKGGQEVPETLARDTAKVGTAPPHLSKNSSGTRDPRRSAEDEMIAERTAAHRRWQQEREAEEAERAAEMPDPDTVAATLAEARSQLKRNRRQ